MKFTVHSTDITTILNSDQAMISFGEVIPDGEVVKFFVSAEKVRLYALSDAIEQSGLATIHMADTEKGLILIEKTKEYTRKKFIAFIISFFKK